jgi:hypothetical protein
MPVDTRGLTQQHVGKRLCLELTTGDVEEVDALELTVCDQAEPCCGITYRLTRSNKVDSPKQEGSVYWVSFDEIKAFHALGDGLV